MYLQKSGDGKRCYATVAIGDEVLEVAVARGHGIGMKHGHLEEGVGKEWVYCEVDQLHLGGGKWLHCAIHLMLAWNWDPLHMIWNRDPLCKVWNWNTNRSKQQAVGTLPSQPNLSPDSKSSPRQTEWSALLR